jgi:hypothetical protein
VAKRPQITRAWLRLGSQTTTYLRELFLPRLGRTTPRFPGVVSEPSNACHRYPENPASMRDSAPEMARPGLEPGTPRFSVVRSCHWSSADLQGFPADQSRSSGLGFSRILRSFLGEKGRRRGPSAFSQDRATCPVGDVQPTTKRTATNPRRWPAAAAPACPFVEIRMSLPTWERHRAALSALERGVSREVSSADTSRFALGLAQDGLRPSWRDAPRAPMRPSIVRSAHQARRSSAAHVRDAASRQPPLDRGGSERACLCGAGPITRPRRRSWFP